MSDEDAADRYRTGTAERDAADATESEAPATDGAAADPTVTDENAAEIDRETVEDRSDQHEPEEDEKLLARVPEWVVALGAGSLLAATLLTGIGSVFLWYSVSQGRWYGFAPYKVVMLTVQFTAVTAFQALAVRWARRRIRWMWVMLAAIGGSLTFVALPFTAIALLCIGLGKYHFTFDTPASVIRGGDG